MRFAPRLSSPIRAVAMAAAVTAVPLGLLLATSPDSSAATRAADAFPAHYAAPYLQVSSSDVGDMAADMSASGDKYYTLAFLTPKSGGCTPMWEDNNQAMGSFTSQVKALQAKGGNVIASFGGESGGEISEKCGSASAAEAQYASVVKTYGITRLDFDIEGSTLSNTSANTLRDKALAMLQKANKAVTVDFTLAVNPNGLPGNEVTLLKGAVNAGVNVNLVNIMIMDFGNGQNPLKDGESAAKATAKQLESVFGVSKPDYAGMGLTPIAGKNDDKETFSQANAKTLESFAHGKGVQELAFWEVQQYDKKVGYAYSKIFNKITG